MKFSLKTMLITVCVLGATIGVMGKLLMERPEAFFQVLYVFATVVPFLLAIGTIIGIGLRGKLGYSAAVCAKCTHDLRSVELNRTPICPGCGADLGKPGSVLFARRQQIAWRLVVWGLALLLMPFMVYGALSVLWPSGNPLRVLSNRRLIQDRLPKQVEAPWVWNELAYRLNSRGLSQQEVDQAIRELITYMKSTSPTGWNQPLAWQRTFVQTAWQAQLISEDIFLELCDAFYGPAPIVQPLQPILEQSGGFQLVIKYGNPFANTSNLGIQLLWQVTAVQIDGIPQKIGGFTKVADRWSGAIDSKLEHGDHEITVDVECAYVDQDKLISLNPFDLPIEQWPKTRKRWTKTLSIPLKVESAELK